MYLSMYLLSKLESTRCAFCVHCMYVGAGCISESLGLKKPLIVVINDKLMNNHQRELADQLSEEGYLLSTSPK